MPIILFIGCITSYEDFKFSKIRNKWVLTGVLYSLTVYSLSWVLYKLSMRQIIDSNIGTLASHLVWNFDKWIINIVISTLVAYLLWHFKIWGAGDGKLFICYSALVPMGKYHWVYFEYYFVSFLLLLTIFIPATAFLLLRSSIHSVRKFDFRDIKAKISILVKTKQDKFNRAELAKVLLGFCVFFLLFRTLRSEFRSLIYKILPNQNMVMLISLVAFRQLSKIFKKRAKMMAFIFILLAGYLVIKMAYSWTESMLELSNILSRAVLIMVMFRIIRKIISIYTERTVQKTVPFAHWMFLGALIAWLI
ncbi:MAG: prepilin peptidase [Deltaproteobacteria bacterium]|nr:prepilin peptidase [Deltaproteobacteria bacterium]